MSPLRPTQLFLLLVCSLLVLSIPAFAQTQANIAGDVSVSNNSSRPDLGAWEYTLTLSWDTGSGRNMSHFDIMLDEVARACSNTEIQTGFVPGDTVGLAPLDIKCDVYFQPEFMFQGDPMVSTPGQMMKIAPFPNQNEVPGPSGSGVFKIFSDFGPTGFEYPGLFLVDAAGDHVCSGMIMGFFPALTCDPVHAEKRNWDYVKALYGNR